MRAQGKEETEVLVAESLPECLPVLHEVLLCSLISHSPWSSHEDDNYGILITREWRGGGESFTQNPKAFKLRAVVSTRLIQLPRCCDTFTL